MAARLFAPVFRRPVFLDAPEVLRLGLAVDRFRLRAFADDFFRLGLFADDFFRLGLFEVDRFRVGFLVADFFRLDVLAAELFRLVRLAVDLLGPDRFAVDRFRVGRLLAAFVRLATVFRLVDFFVGRFLAVFFLLEGLRPAASAALSLTVADTSPALSSAISCILSATTPTTFWAVSVARTFLPASVTDWVMLLRSAMPPPSTVVRHPVLSQDRRVQACSDVQHPA